MKKLCSVLLVCVLLLSLWACGEEKIPAGTCTLSISCENLLGHEKELAQGKRALVPKDGWILPPQEFTFYEGESVFDLLQRVTREQKIHLEFSKSVLYSSVYVEGIGNLYETDCGGSSGWMFSVNGEFPNQGCSAIALSDGDSIAWNYTLNLGADLGHAVEDQP